MVEFDPRTPGKQTDGVVFVYNLRILVAKWQVET